MRLAEDLDGESFMIGGLAFVARDQGDLEEAGMLMAESIRITLENGGELADWQRIDRVTNPE